MTAGNALARLVKKEFTQEIRVVPSDDIFDSFAKTGIRYGFKFLVDNIDNISQIFSSRQYRNVVLVDFSNVVRNLLFLSYLQHFGYPVSDYFDFNKVVDYNNFLYVLPMVVNFLSYWQDYFFIIFVPGGQYSVDNSDNGNVWTVTIPCQRDSIPCHVLYGKNEVDDHALVITHFILKSILGTGRVGILSVDYYKWATDPRDAHYSRYHGLLNRCFEPNLNKTIEHHKHPIDHKRLYANTLNGSHLVIENNGDGPDFMNGMIYVM